MERINNWLEKLRGKLSRRKRMELHPNWLRNKLDKAVQGEKLVTVEVVKPLKVKLYWLRPLKRVLAGILFVLNVSTSLLALSSSSMEGFLIFFPNAFILLDYLWKTRSQ